MPGKWHNAVVKALFELCEEHDSYDKIWDGNKRPIGISVGKNTYYYQPDIYASYWRGGKLDVYEVIDSESEAELLMDIVYSALVPNAETIAMIFSNAQKLERARLHAKIILSRLCQESLTFEGTSVYYEPLIELFQSKYFVHVPKRTNARSIRNILKKRLDF